MLNIDEIYDVTIVDIARETDGIAKIDGMTIFVPGTKVGDKVTIKIERLFTKFAMGKKI
jgi:predicted RNA-binding protein with TRAM domain